jgi:hypothetical protein
MRKQLILAVTFVSLIGLNAPLGAEVPATLVLRSGERVSGELIDLGGVGFTIRVNGQERRVAQDEVAVVEFAGGQPNAQVRSKVAGGQQVVVMRNGDVIEGRLVDLGGTSPLRVTVDTPSGQRDLTSADVAQVYMAATGNMRGGQAAGTTGQNGVTTVTVNGNEDWTNTGRTVRAGEVLSFSSTGQVRFSPQANDVAGAAGLQQPMGQGAPVPNAPKGALIGRIDQGTPFLIANKQQVPMPADGTLYLGINDDVNDDNSGALQVKFNAPVAVPRAR